jgi:predicted nucleotidyltransferase
MTRAQTLSALSQAKPELARRFGVLRLGLFGSAVRGDARSDSDVDIVVSFDGPASSKRYFGVQFFLEDLLGRPVDLVTDKALRPELRPYIEKELVDV